MYKLKFKPNGTIERHKSHLVAKGFHQTYGLNYFEIFSLMIKPTTIRIVLLLALSKDWLIKQLDVHSAFFNGTLEEEVYMAQPQGFVDFVYPHHVCKLHKALYGFKTLDLGSLS